MIIKTFSDESVKRAKAAYALGFDTIQRYDEVRYNGKIRIPHVRMRNVYTSCELDPSFFPELEADEEVAVTYIMYFKECNRVYNENDTHPREGGRGWNS